MMKPTRHAAIFGTMLLLAGLLMAGPALAQQPRGMGVPPSALPEDLQGEKVQDYFVPCDFREVGVLHGLNGNVVVVHGAGKGAYFGKPGDKLFESDTIHTLADSRCRLRFYSDDVVNMAPDTTFGIDSFEDSRKEKKKTSLFSMLKGKAMFYALRLFRYRDTRFRVKTPTAIVGVRGTKFGVDIFYVEGKSAGSQAVQVADSGRGFDAYIAQAQTQGLQPVAVVACGDGTLDLVDPATGDQIAQVFPNEDFNTLTMDKRFDPTNAVLLNIQSQSQVVEEGQTPKGPEDVGLLAPPPSEFVLGEGFTSEDLSELLAWLLSVINIETGLDIESGGGGIVPYEGTSEKPLVGYFSALVLGSIHDAFVSNHPQQLDPLSDAFAYGIEKSSDYIKGYENSGGDDTAELYIDDISETSNPFSIEGTENYFGQLSYLQWGYHVSSTPLDPTFSDPAYEYPIENKIWFVEGFPTGDSCLASLNAMSATYTYNGDALGSYYNSSTGLKTDLSGTYSSKVNFGSSEMSDFIMNLSGGGQSVSFTQTSAVSITSPPTANGGYFEMSGGDGTFLINGAGASFWQVNGTHYGPDAQEQGGAWAGKAPDEAVWGVFGGSR